MSLCVCICAICIWFWIWIRSTYILCRLFRALIQPVFVVCVNFTENMYCHATLPTYIVALRRRVHSFLFSFKLIYLKNITKTERTKNRVEDLFAAEAGTRSRKHMWRRRHIHTHTRTMCNEIQTQHHKVLANINLSILLVSFWIKCDDCVALQRKRIFDALGPSWCRQVECSWGKRDAKRIYIQY